MDSQPAFQRRNRSRSRKPNKGINGIGGRARSKSDSRTRSNSVPLIIAPNLDLKDPRLTKMRTLASILAYQAALLTVLTSLCLIFSDYKLVLFLIFATVENGVTFFVYGLDKGNAGMQRWRVPERTLHLFCLFYGFAGTLAAMQLFRHKTCKGVFIWNTLICTAISCGLYYVLYYFVFNILP